MTDEEKKYQEDLAKAGVDLPELKKEEGEEDPEEKAKAEAEAKAKAEADAKAKEEADAKAKADAESDDDGENDEDENPTGEKKRSIYDAYKGKKKEVKTERERAEIAEKERDELKAKLEAIQSAENPKEKKDALDDLDKFAEEIEADPEVLKKMRDLIIKDLKPDESLQKDLLEFKQWKADNSKIIAKQQFNDEFEKTLPAIKSFFPTANEGEIKSIKNQLDVISHSKGWNDKDLEYIAFKHKDKLSALVSPKKRGMENSDHKQNDLENKTEFDPSADYARMTPTQKAQWEKDYNALMKKSEGLTDRPGGGKIMI